ncbi:DUF2917 domain-containing protein [Cupriavidus consociatus]|uniref:DUF2917 domain-containing protein n=1 Tax=Cupriavidus consociatus TaxID=2821357 RepID=UPI001AEB5F06|nr:MULTISPECIES: DUF2917 domain-containing protein [unclassified Cupriavidus]MBP0619047.1 DUF2917 domain-containing protein [Cupriavidus sp. LEh25]MDK2655693.1 DUF2917 domain-containing protein [Cupriavidus sp. LEh21]
MSSCTLSIEAECRRLQLPAGAELVCCGGSLWLTFEDGDRPSPDVMLAPGERYRLHRDADVFVAALHGTGPALCRVEAPSRSGSAGSSWVRRFRWLWRAWAS